MSVNSLICTVGVASLGILLESRVFKDRVLVSMDVLCVVAMLLLLSYWSLVHSAMHVCTELLWRIYVALG